MRSEIAGPVYNVFRKGLELRERLQRNPEGLDFQKEQTQLKETLRKVPDIGRETGEGSDRFLGLRYPLACWLDEIFILDSSWGESWNEQSMEMSFNSTRDRSWLFWEQARLAEARAGGEVLEVFFLCVMLGFRGELRGDPYKLQDWYKSARSLIFQDQQRKWPMPDERQPPTFVPPLTGANRRQTMAMIAIATALLLIPAGLFFFLRSFQGT